MKNQKLKDGKNLIRYFCVTCKPMRSYGGRTRNLQALEVLELLKEYEQKRGTIR